MHRIIHNNANIYTKRAGRQTRKQAIKQRIIGDTRDKIAIDNGTVSSVVNSWKRGLENSEYESVRVKNSSILNELVNLVKQGL